MCGITGLWDFRGRMTAEQRVEQVTRMRDTLQHRGPDAAGVWDDPVAGIALGHRRLSIVDLSALGHQPMSSSSRRYVITYNGEIYNFKKLRADLEAVGHTFTSQSDTEILLESIEAWGLERALNSFNGMFAFALWDRAERVLTLACDRFGEKPLYYGEMSGTFLFGSELKALREFDNFERRVDLGSVAQLLRYTCIPAPQSIYASIRKLTPGTCLRVSTLGVQPATRYWLPRGAAGSASHHQITNERDALAKLDDALRASIEMRMIADVPLGAFLSGGIDSSLVVALMQSRSTRAVRTFTIGFTEEAYNEAGDAKRVADYLRTDHVELYVTPEQALAVIPNLPQLYDEPFADSSQIPTYLVSTLARQHVTVALSGDGGDELFGGYNRYAWSARIWRTMSLLPLQLRGYAERLMTRFSPEEWDVAYSKIIAALPGRAPLRIFGDKVHKLAGVLTADSDTDLYLRLISAWQHPFDVLNDGREPPTLRAPDFGTFTERMMLTDTETYLPNDILVKVDRAAMGVSLESRMPMLDPGVFDVAWSIPLSLRLRDRKPKYLLRALLGRYLPPNLFERPKMGFGVPIDRWLRGRLRDWAEDLLDEKQLTEDGMFVSSVVRRKWAEHLSCAHNWQHQLWPILMYRAWAKANRV